MDTLRNSLKDFSGLRYLVDSLKLSSAPAKRMLLATSWSSDPLKIQERIDEVAKFLAMLEHEKQGKGLARVAELLCYLRIVAGSIDTLASGSTCSDIDFFELKGLALLEGKVRDIIRECDLQLVEMPSLHEVLVTLDPEGTRLETFYLADSYSEDLARLRKAQENAPDEETRSQIALDVAVEEERVRRRLSKKLRPTVDDLLATYNALAKDDILIAKAQWAMSNNGVKPVPLSEGTSELIALWNPEVRAVLKEKGEKFQPVSISFDQTPTLITGANMAGKSVLLSSVALAQILMQYGFYLPAEKASLVVVEDVMTSFSDGQDASKGLSSYAAEILRLNAMIQEIKAGKRMLLLIDEAARTTNPEEGRAIVEALVKVFSKYSSRSIITTHYSGIKALARRYRVRGFIEDKIHQPPEVNRLNKCMDYSLVLTDKEESPQEAIRIAEILGVDEEFLSLSKLSYSEHCQRKSEE